MSFQKDGYSFYFMQNPWVFLRTYRLTIAFNIKISFKLLSQLRKIEPR